jgi:hypothetical protein
MAVSISWDPTSPLDVDLGLNERENVESARRYTRELVNILDQGLSGVSETEKMGYSNHG